MSRHLGNPYYWLFGFVVGLITGAIMATMIQGGAPSTGAGTSPADKLLSGNGSHTITAKAWDGAGNEGIGRSTFPAKYDAQFSETSGNVNTARPADSQAKFKFTLRLGTARSESASDGVFVFDKTISGVLVRASDDAPMATHFYSMSGGVLRNVLISQTDPLSPSYETHFKRGDLIDPNTGLAPTGSGIYVLKVYARGVDGNWMLQATSSSVAF